MHEASSLDTNPAIDVVMMDRFASMTMAERAEVMNDLSEMCTKLALAGIRAQHGDLSIEDMRWHLCARRYGEALADEVYGPRTYP